MTIALFIGVIQLILSAAICRLIIAKKFIIAHPNTRSSHLRPIPTSGGLGIVIAYMIGMVMNSYFFTPTFNLSFIQWSCIIVIAPCMLAMISFCDDVFNIFFLKKLLFQLGCAMFVMLLGCYLNSLQLPSGRQVNLGWFGYIITGIWILGLTNAFNFMDGINGLAGGTAILTSVFYGVISVIYNDMQMAYICMFLICSTLGFLIFNFPKAQIFMGDVGSVFLGFLFSLFALFKSNFSVSSVPFWVIPLLLFHFIYDTSFTFIARLIRKEPVFQAHRRHLYQLFTRLGFSHVFVSCFYFSINILQGLTAIILVWFPLKSSAVLYVVFILMLMIHLLYSSIIIRKATNADLI